VNLRSYFPEEELCNAPPLRAGPSPGRPALMKRSELEAAGEPRDPGALLPQGLSWQLRPLWSPWAAEAQAQPPSQRGLPPAGPCNQSSSGGGRVPPGHCGRVGGRVIPPGDGAFGLAQATLQGLPMKSSA